MSRCCPCCRVTLWALASTVHSPRPLFRASSSQGPCRTIVTTSSASCLGSHGSQNYHVYNRRHPRLLVPKDFVAKSAMNQLMQNRPLNLQDQYLSFESKQGGRALLFCERLFGTYSSFNGHAYCRQLNLQRLMPDSRGDSKTLRDSTGWGKRCLCRSKQCRFFVYGGLGNEFGMN